MSRDLHYTLPSVKQKQRAALFSLIAVLTVGTAIYLGFNPIQLFTEFHAIADLVGSMLPPHFELLVKNKDIGWSIVETVSMSFLGTLFGGVMAVVFSFLAATNTMPFLVVRMTVRAFLSILRVTPALIVILVFVVAVGLGAFAGMLSLIVTTIGTFGQLFTEIIENVESAPAEAIYSVGATRWQVIRYAIFPQVLPSFVANFLYSFDINLRAAIGLGIFGGGGIGFELFMAMRILHYRDALALVCLTVVLIVCMEKLSDFLRRKILAEGKL